MPQYKAPLKDMDFILNDVLDIQGHYQGLPGGEDASPETVDAILCECAKFCENVLSPLNAVGDREGCSLSDGVVSTPTGYKEAYQQFIDGGWQGLSHPTEYGGQGLPLSLGVVKAEMVGTANWTWGMYPGLSLGAMNTIMTHGSEQQKQDYLVPLTEGRWTGTMCLTESHCGTDLAQVKTQAVDNGDGSYSMTGSKIFISSGDHDLTDNIVHVVIARTPDMPEGMEGISLFIVPKYLPGEGGSQGEYNNVSCGALEHKMGIHGSSTCVINFDGAKAFLLGEKGRGVNNMFTFMNTARIGTALQGVGAAELALQGALPYAIDRGSMRSLTGTKNPELPADKIIHHPDVRRMLLTCKAIAEGGRALAYHTAIKADTMMAAKTPEAYAEADEILGFFTPILKGFMTETGFEAANLGMQVFGGHGYIKEWGMEQNVRDVRIATLYEGTTGIQAMDLLARKILLGKFKTLNLFTREVLGFCKNQSLVSRNPHKKEMNKFIWPLTKYTLRWKLSSLRLALRARKSEDRDAIGSAAYDYLMYSGYITLAYFWARMAQTAYEKLAEGAGDADFYRAKIQTAEFYFDRLLPRTAAHEALMLKDPRSLMQMDQEHFHFA